MSTQVKICGLSLNRVDDLDRRGSVRLLNGRCQNMCLDRSVCNQPLVAHPDAPAPQAHRNAPAPQGKLDYFYLT